MTYIERLTKHNLAWSIICISKLCKQSYISYKAPIHDPLSNINIQFLHNNNDNSLFQYLIKILSRDITKCQIRDVDSSNDHIALTSFFAPALLSEVCHITERSNKFNPKSYSFMTFRDHTFKCFIGYFNGSESILYKSVTSRERHGVPNERQLDYLVNSLISLAT